MRRSTGFGDSQTGLIRRLNGLKSDTKTGSMLVVHIVTDRKLSSGQPNSDSAKHVRLLMAVAQNRDRQAFTELFEYYGPRLKSFMMRKGADAELAEDLAQEAMIAVWNKAGLYQAGKGSVSTWVYTIARNLRIDRLRRERSNIYYDIDDFDEPSSDPLSDELVSNNQEAKHVAEALNTLPEEQRHIMVMAFMEDKTQAEISGLLDLPLGTVKSRMRLAYRKMSEALKEIK